MEIRIAVSNETLFIFIFHMIVNIYFKSKCTNENLTIQLVNISIKDIDEIGISPYLRKNKKT